MGVPRFNGRIILFVSLVALLPISTACSMKRLNSQPPTYEVFLNGIQTTNGTSKQTTSLNNCTETLSQDEHEVVEFGMSTPLLAIGGSQQHEITLSQYLPNRDAQGHLKSGSVTTIPASQAKLDGEVNRQSHFSVTGTCDYGGRGSGGGHPPPIDCGQKKLFPTVMDLNLIHDQLKGTTKLPFDSDPSYQNCGKLIIPLYYAYNHALIATIPTDTLNANNKEVVVVTGHDVNGILPLTAGVTGSSTVDWQMTFCQTVNNLTYEQAKQMAWDDLNKSGTFIDSKEIAGPNPVSEGQLADGDVGTAEDARGNHPSRITVDWTQIFSRTGLVGVLAHEFGHEVHFNDVGYTPEEAAPYLETFAQYAAVRWEEEYQADRFALKVLQELMKSQPDRAPCILAYIDSIPDIKHLAAGDDAGARQAIKDIYPIQPEDFTKAQQSTKYPEVEPLVQKTNLSQLVTTWGAK